jgi:YidC/Oxa1 family membrane protein insertase
MDNPQTAIMQKLMLYVFPIGVVVGAPFLPLAILIYWVSNNLWTLGQQYVVYRRIDAEQAEKKEQAAANRQALAPRPGQKPVRPERADAEPAEPPAKKPGAKPVMRKQAPASTNTSTNSAPSASTNGSTSGDASTNGTAKNGDHGTAGAGSRKAGATPSARRPRKRR